MSEPGRIRVLFVEDDAQQHEMVCDYLARSDFGFVTTVASSLANALREARAGTFDVILLDLNLPDSRGLATLDALRAAVGTPIVVLTAQHDTDLTREIMHHGAQDFVPKDPQTPRFLARVVYYAVERARLQAEVDRATDVASRLREAQTLGAVGRPKLTVTAEMMGEHGLQQAAPAQFTECVRLFREAVGATLEAQIYRGREPDTRNRLLQLADLLGRARATPPDIIDTYRGALAAPATEAGATGLTAAWREEARLLLIGLLGHVLSYYRMRAVSDNFTTSDPS